MYTTTEHRTIVSMLAQGRPVWYVAAVTKLHMHEVNHVGRAYGYPDAHKLRQALAEFAPTAA
ncbi:MAG TPA: hypothetical protein VEK80_14670 [Kribbellaceae bacterium]|nr:hypothetical protein [Kribbellaceae bacterium]